MRQKHINFESASDVSLAPGRDPTRRRGSTLGRKLGLGLFIPQPEGSVTHLGKLLEGTTHRVVGTGTYVVHRHLAHGVVGVRHRDGVPRDLEHLQVVVRVAEGDYLVGVNGEQDLQDADP